MIGFIKKLFSLNRSEQAPPPKWALEPDRYGGYYLMKWRPDIGMYLAEASGVRDEEHAERIIASLERQTKYFYGGEND